MSESQLQQTETETAPDREEGPINDSPGNAVQHEPEQPGHLVPVSEAKKYRKRAQAAEKILDDLKAELAQKNEALSEQRKTITDMQRQRLIDELLVDAEAIDLETTRLMTDMTLAEMPEPDIEEAIAQLRRHKPFLFRVTARSATALSPKAENDQPPIARSLEHAAAEARSSGNRTALLRYLRLRRRSSR